MKTIYLDRMRSIRYSLLRVLLFVCVWLPSTGSIAQNINFSVANVTVREALLKIQREQGLTIVMHATGIDMERRVTVTSKNESIKQVLLKIFSGQNLDFNVSGRKVIIEKRKKKNVDDTKLTTVAKKMIHVYGTVSSLDEGEPLTGVTVKATGSLLGTVTDIDGNYALDVPEGAMLEFSYIGYNTKTAKATTGHPVNIKLGEDTKLINEVVVVGYGIQKKINLTGAVGVIDADEINGRPTASALQALQGLDPSLNITMNSGKASAGATINIRGAASLNSSSPLILVDGIEMGLGNVNPNDIESVSILKDASASAVYGAKASAGVLLITTKSGSKGEPKISYNGRLGVISNTTSTHFMNNGYDWLRLADEFYYSGKALPYSKYTDEDFAELWMRWGETAPTEQHPWVVAQEGTGYYKYYANTDWYGWYYKRHHTQMEHNATVRGGDDKLNYYVSGRLYSTSGVFRQQEDPYKSHNLRAKIGIQLRPWLKYTLNAVYFHDKSEWIGPANIQKIFSYTPIGSVPYINPTNPDGSAVMNPQYLSGQNAMVGNATAAAFIYGKGRNYSKTDNVIIKNSLDATLTKGLVFHLNYSYGYYHDFTSNRQTDIPYSAQEGVTSYKVSGGFAGNQLHEEGSTAYKNMLEGFLDFTHTWNKSHNLKVMAGWQYDKKQTKTNGATATDLLTDDLSDFNLQSDDNIQTITGGQTAYQTLGIFGRINYDYKGKYLIELSGREDGTSRFWSKHRWGFFPSGSLGYRISEEKFWEPLKNIWSNAKIRFSVGSLGNQQVSNYLFIQTIKSTTDNGFTFDQNGNNLTYFYETQPVSDNLTWENVTTYDWGLDLGFLNNRLNITADYYIRDTKNMMMSGASVPAVYGYNSTPKENNADMRTHGWELGISWRDNINVLSKPLSYTLRANIGGYKSKVTRFDNQTGKLGDHYVGETVGEIWGWVCDGLFKSDEEAAQYCQDIDCSLVYKNFTTGGVEYRTALGGDMRFVDLDGDGKISRGGGTIEDPGDRKILGNSLPKFTYSFGADASWNNIDFSILFQGIGKTSWYPTYQGSDTFFGMFNRVTSGFLSQEFVNQLWTPDRTDAYFPLPRGYEAYNSGSPLGMVNSRYLQNVAYLRLKSLEIGYTIPVLRKWFQQIRVYANGENLYYWSPLKKHTRHIDPEQCTSSASTTSGSAEAYFFNKIVSVGVDITF